MADPTTATETGLNAMAMPTSVRVNTIVMPTWNNVEYLARAVESIHDLTEQAKWRLVIIDNGSADQTAEYLQDRVTAGYPITVIRNQENRGFVVATNQGLEQVQRGENVMLANDDIQIVDRLWLAQLEADLADPQVGMVVPTSNYVMGLQKMELSAIIPYTVHETPLCIYFAGLMRWDVFERIGKLDERFLKGGNDDLDYSIRMQDAGYKLLVDRRVYVHHYGSRTLLRENDMDSYNKVNTDTRALLVEKHGQARVDRVLDFNTIRPYVRRDLANPYGAEYYASFGHGGYCRNTFWLNEWKRIAGELPKSIKTLFDAGCAHGMLVEVLRDMGVQAYGMDISAYAVTQAREDIKQYLQIGSLINWNGTERYDLVTCIETLEHLTEEDGKVAIANICDHAERVLFSSTPDDRSEPTHRNVRPKPYWVKLFRQHGFRLDPTYDGSWLTPYTCLFMKE